jgi:hypothetical protein
MRRLAGLIGGAVWGFVAYQLWKRWQTSAVPPAPAAEDADARAEELRAKLAAARASDEQAPAESPENPGSVEERRRHVHEEGRAAIDRMNDT